MSHKTSEYAPPIAPSQFQQIDALKKGLGRARIWARDGQLHSSLLLDACLYDKRYDYQCDSPRGDWLWELVKAARFQLRFRDRIYEAIARFDSEHACAQLCDFATQFALNGDNEFKMRLYEISATTPNENDPSLGVVGILKLDGFDGFRALAKIRGQELGRRVWDWQDDSLIEDAIDLVAEAALLLRDNIGDDKDIERFVVNWQQQELKKKSKTSVKRKTLKERMKEISLEEILAEARKEKPSIGKLRGWGMHAFDDDLLGVMLALKRATNPNEIKNLLRIYSARPFPILEDWLFELSPKLQHNDRDFLFSALSKNTDKRVRDYALSQLTAGDFRAVDMLSRNFRSGDEATILKHLDLSDSEADLSLGFG